MLGYDNHTGPVPQCVLRRIAKAQNFCRSLKRSLSGVLSLSSGHDVDPARTCFVYFCVHPTPVLLVQQLDVQHSSTFSTKTPAHWCSGYVSAFEISVRMQRIDDTICFPKFIAASKSFWTLRTCVLITQFYSSCSSHFSLSRFGFLVDILTGNYHRIQSVSLSFHLCQVHLQTQLYAIQVQYFVLYTTTFQTRGLAHLSWQAKKVVKVSSDPIK